MKSFAAALILIALVALAAMSFAPASLVGLRAGFTSLAGVVTAGALLAIALAGGWLWLKEKRRKND
jgi:hypothetical protein